MNKTVQIPLLRDHHTHPLLYAAFSPVASLADVHSKSEAIELIQSAYCADSDIIIAHGWRSNLFAWSTIDLEKLPPVAIFNVSLHGLLLNQAGAAVVRKHHGDLVDKLSDQDWYESNFRRILNWFANLNANQQGLLDFYEDLSKQGIYFAEEMLLIDEQEIEIFKTTGLINRTRFWAAPDTFADLSEPAKECVHGLKLFTDGALGTRSAALHRNYFSETGLRDSNRGVLLYSDESLARTILGCAETGKSLAIHAIGDRALEQLVTVLESMKSKVANFPEVRIEHAQLITCDIARRAKALGVVLSMQPNFSSDSKFYRDRIDVEYCRGNNPFRMLIDQAGFEAGVDLVFGSDGMPHGVEYALEQSLFPSLESQKLTLAEFQAGYCLDDVSNGHINIRLDEEKVASCSVTISAD